MRWIKSSGPGVDLHAVSCTLSARASTSAVTRRKLDPEPAQVPYTPRWTAGGARWVAPSGVIGAADGLPWAWLRVGTLPSVVFGALGMALGAWQWMSGVIGAKRATAARTALGGGILGTCVVSLFGLARRVHLDQSLLLGCFRLRGGPVYFLAGINDFSVEAGWINRTFAFVECANAGALLHARWRRMCSSFLPRGEL